MRYHLHLYLAGLRPHSHADADVARALSDGKRHHSIKAESREHQSEAAQGYRELRRYTRAVDVRCFSEHRFHRSHAENQTWFLRESFFARQLFHAGGVARGAHQQLAILIYKRGLRRVE